MCGLTGIFAYNPCAAVPNRRELRASRDYMRARGPDGAGEWWGEDGRIGLGHRRLSIIDLSQQADQPMTSSDGRYVIVFNGEIYNHLELRSKLEKRGACFRTTSDTEVLLQLYALYGVEMFQQIRGMYAFAIWDVRDGNLLLARDPYGIKPLYISNDGWTFRFASQVKALLEGRAISRDLDPAGVVGFHLWGCVPEPFTLYRDICSLRAGHFQFVDECGPREPQAFALLPPAFGQSPTPSEETRWRVREAVLDSVSAHLVADVEVGLFLSAGVDSGALLGLMKDAGQTKTRAITLAFEEFRNTTEDESPLAAQVAEFYGAAHFVRRVSRSEFDADLDAILAAMDQPSIEGVNTWFVAKAAREVGLKVALSGVGGDELLAGYPSFIDLPRWVGLLGLPSMVPGLGRGVRAITSALGLAANSPKLRSMLEYGGSYAGAYLLRRGLFLPHELSEVLDEPFAREGLRRICVLRSLRADSLTPDPVASNARIASLESSQYMRNMLLRDADWAGMAHSLEIRTPLVDYTLLRALGPVVAGLRPGDGKRALASAPSTPLPSFITDRAKTGFGVPTGQWIADAADTDLSRKGLASRAWARKVYSGFEKQSVSVGPPAEVVAVQ
jgi:asparagine synthase (glutamine-hydrolysing)